DGGPPQPLLVGGSSALEGLATSPAGEVHTFAWDFAAQLAAGAGRTTGVRVQVTVREGGSEAGTPELILGNDAPVVRIDNVPSGQMTSVVPIKLTISDSSADAVAVQVEYDRLGDAHGWRPATPLGLGLGDIAATPEGTSVTFLWDVAHDEPSAEFTAVVRFVPADAWVTGSAVETPPIRIDANAPPAVLVNGSAFVSSPDARRGLVVPFTVSDAEGDPVTVAWQWRTATGEFPELPDDADALAAILGDPALRRQYQIATPFPVAARGVLGSTSADLVRIPDALLGASLLRADALVGSKLQVLRRVGLPAPVTWRDGALQAPVAVLARAEGLAALVLERPAASQWRLRAASLAEERIGDVFASGAHGGADALAPHPAGGCLVATSLAGHWSLLRVADDGSVAVWYADAGATANGAVRGLAVPRDGVAFLTVTDRIVCVDARDGHAPQARTILSGLVGPAGLVVDPANPELLYVAERDVVVGSTVGRLLAVNLGQGTRNALAVSGTTAPRPSALALSPDGTNLWFVTDEDTTDGSVELRCVRTNGGAGGPAWRMPGTLAAGVAHLAVGDERLLLACNPMSGALLVSGGVAQERVITAFAPQTAEATVAPPLDPIPAPGARWRIERDGSRLPAGRKHGVLVWDSRDAPPGESVVLRALPFDTDLGLGSDTGVPRPVRIGLQVAPQFVGGLPGNEGICAVRLVDMNQDGLPDLITANRSAHTLTVFHQGNRGTFAGTPGVILAGLTFLAPNDLIAIDLDSDGDMDLASANVTSNNVMIAQQLTAQLFTILPLLVPIANQPRALAGGDLNGDGRVDLVCASAGNDTIQIYFQLLAGLILPLPSQSLTDANADEPVDVELADIDGDGDLDIVSCNRASRKITVFRQTSTGVFATTASIVLGGPGVLEEPVCIVVRDLDGDGRVDIAVADKAGNKVCVFTQQQNGSFPTVPSAVLASAWGPTLPNGVVAADVNTDGALDLVVTDATSVLAFLRDPVTGTYRPKPYVLNTTPLASPTGCAVADIDRDGLADVAVANEGAGNAAVLVQVGPGSFRGQLPSTTVGQALVTPQVEGVAVADLDGDGDLDVVCACAGNGRLVAYEQLAPGVLARDPMFSIGNTATAGASAVVAADLDGDGGIELAAANRTAGTVAVFRRDADGTYPAAPQQVLGAGVLQQPAHLAAADLDGDGDLDLVCADAAAGRLFVFEQVAPGQFATAPVAVLGSAATTAGANTVVAVDLDGDGDCDLACSAGSANVIAVFLRGPGGFPTLPDRVLGSAAATAGARGLAAVRLDADDLIDLVCATSTGFPVVAFRATAPGVWPTVPDVKFDGGALADPGALAAGDLNRDDLPDLVVASRTTDRLAALQQIGGATFLNPPSEFGSAGATRDASQVLIVDLDGDGDPDVISVHPDLDTVAVFFNAH
ncbi:MAG TPA: VCBS repeat-containing protein, partial [Planctomycetota bacterium]|nr:VCBS repeat-containing protein [Planctomycetota bacterium]